MSLKARDHQLQQGCLRSDRHRTGAGINPFMRVNEPEIIASARQFGDSANVSGSDTRLEKQLRISHFSIVDILPFLMIYKQFPG
ncbi:MAG: hypothetical protein ACXWIH_24800 [Burkholderiales bacterium]